MNTSTHKPLIGIVGGMGPAAGVDLANKIILSTRATGDHDHIAQVLYTDAASIGDRTAFLLGESSVNPGHAIARILLKLNALGASVAGIPCNTAHAPEIFRCVTDDLRKNNARLRLLNMIDAVGLFLEESFPEVKQIGILGTTGVFLARPYDRLVQHGIQCLYLPDEEQRQLHLAIYHASWGIKATSRLSTRGLQIVRDLIRYFANHGANAVVLACTELALVDNGLLQAEIPVVNSTLALARELVRAAAPEKLRPFTG